MLAGTLVLIKLVELLEAVTVDDFLETTVVVVVETDAGAAELQQFAVLLGVRMPGDRQPLAIRIPVVGELGPYVAHRRGPALVGLEGFGRQLVGVVVQHVETVFQFGTVG